jgi:hypothetical protein
MRMRPPPGLLSVVAGEANDVVHIHGDAAGLAHLAEAIDQLRRSLSKGECDHVHLKSNSWGGFDLTETKMQSESSATQVHHLEILAWTPEWKAKHQL